MRIFDRFNNKEQTPVQDTAQVVVGAPAKGTVITMSEIPDPVFSSGVLGQCCGIQPDEGKVFAPVDGKITQLSDTLHAVGIEGTDGVEVLIHVGVDTVEMNGEGFTARIKVGDKVKKGQQLLNMDLEKIINAGHPTVVITAITNSDEFTSIKLVAYGEVEVAADLLTLANE